MISIQTEAIYSATTGIAMISGRVGSGRSSLAYELLNDTIAQRATPPSVAIVTRFAGEIPTTMPTSARIFTALPTAPTIDADIILVDLGGPLNVELSETLMQYAQRSLVIATLHRQGWARSDAPKLTFFPV